MATEVWEELAHTGRRMLPGIPAPCCGPRLAPYAQTFLHTHLHFGGHQSPIAASLHQKRGGLALTGLRLPALQQTPLSPAGTTLPGSSSMPAGH